MIGTKLAHYEITGHLGTGGMGEVYQATDSKLGRSVAIKVLPQTFTHDSERVARLQREARVLASLNHPNIAAIHGLEESAGRHFLVMELVPGETLAERIQRGPIPVEKALGIATQIAEALEAAHEKGVVHRDLKPANIKIYAEDVVKVLDFGLAKVREAEGSGHALSNSPTMLVSTTGIILGTAAYMSPEQAKGKDADRTTDVWALGCVLYEMLTGRAVFEGETVGEVFGSVFRADPDWQRLPGNTPEGIRRLLRRCLQKEPRLRLHDMADVRIEIEESLTAPHEDSPAIRGAAPRRGMLVGISAVALMAMAAILWSSRRAPAPEVRLEMVTPLNQLYLPTRSHAISPDGQKIVFVATAEGQDQLWLRDLVSSAARPLADTNSATSPFWSPDSRSVAFYADNFLKRIDIDSGSIQQVNKSFFVGFGGAWNREGTILFTTSNSDPILRVDAASGQASPVTRLESPQQSRHSFPSFMPDGRHFLYYVDGSPEARGVYGGQLDSSETRRLLVADGPAEFASSGHLLYVRQGTLFAQTFDPVRLDLSGSPIPIATDIAPTSLSVSAAGPITYRAVTARGVQQQFVWFDRNGKELGRLADPIDGGRDPNLSADGRRLALSKLVNGNRDIYLLDIGRETFSRFTFDDAADDAPVWSPDGSSIVFDSTRKGIRDLYRKSIAGVGKEEPLLATPQFKIANDWSPDGRLLLYHGDSDPKLGSAIWALPMQGDPKPSPIVQTNFEQGAAQFSPDGKWIAYQSDETGQFEIYMQPFPGPGARQQVSPDGGLQVRWRRDGKELFFIALDEQLMAVGVQLDSASQSFTLEKPVRLFRTHVGGALQARQQYAVSPQDGQRFLMRTVINPDTPPITIILNWKAKP